MADEPAGSGEDPGKRRMSRRSLLIAGTAGLATTGVVLGTATGTLPVANLLDHALDVSTPPVGPNEVVIKYERVHSQRRKRDVDMVTILPNRARPEQLPVCLLLHGLRGNARRAAPTGLARKLIDLSAAGAIPPFAFVALDGGDNYWHENQRGDNSMAMLLDEVPQWMRSRGLGDADGVPFACAGISMGGFGALLYARRRNERGNPAQAIAAISPGLLTSWREMSTRRAFKDTVEWASLDPLRNVDKLGSVPVGIWCGTEDHFIEGTRKFIKLAKPQVAYTGPGGHGDPFYRRIVPDVLTFLGKHVPQNH
ncbi:alpha/beta hydrolase family protein [Kibdelosporangium persicum]|uniref:S-formylglutathione hydrolase FrmB n=2 Tax=Kibdelosporangium persicum TaxID=2698649 RepID=A0ABX2F6Z4_9PSEU|nr:S-formylglutathione hydrolase FrmB [Kibdelosporangium persicum]